MAANRQHWLDLNWQSGSRAGAPYRGGTSLRGSLKKELTFLRKKIWMEPYKPGYSSQSYAIIKVIPHAQREAVKGQREPEVLATPIPLESREARRKMVSPLPEDTIRASPCPESRKGKVLETYVHQTWQLCGCWRQQEALTIRVCVTTNVDCYEQPIAKRRTIFWKGNDELHFCN